MITFGELLMAFFGEVSSMWKFIAEESAARVPDETDRDDLTLTISTNHGINIGVVFFNEAVFFQCLENRLDAWLRALEAGVENKSFKRIR